jgi:hypothetical protein
VRTGRDQTLVPRTSFASGVLQETSTVRIFSSHIHTYQLAVHDRIMWALARTRGAFRTLSSSASSDLSPPLAELSARAAKAWDTIIVRCELLTLVPVSRLLGNLEQRRPLPTH